MIKIIKTIWEAPNPQICSYFNYLAQKNDFFTGYRKTGVPKNDTSIKLIFQPSDLLIFKA